jgi:hypothetical protein
MKIYKEKYQCIVCGDIVNIKRPLFKVKEIGHRKHMNCSICKTTTMFINKGFATAVGKTQKAFFGSAITDPFTYNIAFSFQKSNYRPLKSLPSLAVDIINNE